MYVGLTKLGMLDLCPWRYVPCVRGLSLGLFVPFLRLLVPCLELFVFRDCVTSLELFVPPCLCPLFRVICPTNVCIPSLGIFVPRICSLFRVVCPAYMSLL